MLHRISGFLLFIALPFLLLLLQYSLDSPETHGHLADVLARPLPKLVILLILWSFFHHFCAGLRYLAIDLHHMVCLSKARSSSKVVLAVSLALTVWVGVALW